MLLWNATVFAWVEVGVSVLWAVLDVVSWLRASVTNVVVRQLAALLAILMAESKPRSAFKRPRQEHLRILLSELRHVELLIYEILVSLDLVFESLISCDHLALRDLHS